jgi:hypothetical protein
MSTENRLFRAYGQGCARSTLIYILVALAVLGGFCCLSVGAFLLPIDQDAKLWVWLVLLLLFMFMAITATVIGSVWTIRKRAVELDATFQPLGLQGRGYLQNGRQYHGTYRGYPIHVYFYRGPTLQIYLDVPLRTRLGIGHKSELARLASSMISKDMLDLDDPEFERLAIYPDDQRWAADLFADPQARAAILRLTGEETATELRSLSITPKALLWQSRYLPVRAITPENVRTWVSDLSELARIAQDLMPPTVAAVESTLEQNIRLDRSKYTGRIIGITCGIIGLMTACMVGVSILLIFLTESGM